MIDLHVPSEHTPIRSCCDDISPGSSPGSQSRSCWRTCCSCPRDLHYGIHIMAVLALFVLWARTTEQRLDVMVRASAFT
jgi:hypothetical protein